MDTLSLKHCRMELSKAGAFRLEIEWRAPVLNNPPFELDWYALITNSSGHVRSKTDIISVDTTNRILSEHGERPCSLDESIVGPPADQDLIDNDGHGKATFDLDLSLMEESKKEIYFALCLFEEYKEFRDPTKRYYLSQVSQLTVSLRRPDDPKPFAIYKLSPVKGQCKGILVCKLSRRTKTWQFSAIGKEIRNGVEDMFSSFLRNGTM